MVCSRCGIEDASGALEKRVERGASRVCQDCRARPAKVVRTAYGECWPHHGEFDEDDNPLDDFGLKLFDGIRKCGKKDCVNPEHIVLAVEIERVFKAPRNGKKLTLAEKWKRLLKEGF